LFILLIIDQLLCIYKTIINFLFLNDILIIRLFTSEWIDIHFLFHIVHLLDFMKLVVFIHFDIKTIIISFFLLMLFVFWLRHIDIPMQHQLQLSIIKHHFIILNTSVMNQIQFLLFHIHNLHIQFYYIPLFTNIQLLLLLLVLLLVLLLLVLLTTICLLIYICIIWFLFNNVHHL